jgi:hypothetical protein
VEVSTLSRPFGTRLPINVRLDSRKTIPTLFLKTVPLSSLFFKTKTVIFLHVVLYLLSTPASARARSTFFPSLPIA